MWTLTAPKFKLSHSLPGRVRSWLPEVSLLYDVYRMGFAHLQIQYRAFLELGRSCPREFTNLMVGALSSSCIGLLCTRRSAESSATIPAEPRLQNGRSALGSERAGACTAITRNGGRWVADPPALSVSGIKLRYAGLQPSNTSVVTPVSGRSGCYKCGPDSSRC